MTEHSHNGSSSNGKRSQGGSPRGGQGSYGGERPGSGRGGYRSYGSNQGRGGRPGAGKGGRPGSSSHGSGPSRSFSSDRRDRRDGGYAGKGSSGGQRGGKPYRSNHPGSSSDRADGAKRGYGARSYGGKKSYGDSKPHGFKKPYAGKKPYNDRSRDGGAQGRRPYKADERRGGDRKPYGSGPRRDDGRTSYSSGPHRDSDRKPHASDPRRSNGRAPYGAPRSGGGRGFDRKLGSGQGRPFDRDAKRSDARPNARGTDRPKRSSERDSRSGARAGTPARRTHLTPAARHDARFKESGFVYRGALEDKRDRMGGPRTGPRGGRGFDAKPRRPFDDKPRRDAKKRPAPLKLRLKDESIERKFRVADGRVAAYAIGRAVRERGAYVSSVAPTVTARIEGIDPKDVAFATRLSKGVAATWGTLDEFIDRTMSSPDDIQADVRDALRVSAYELVFLHKPPHVVVDQGVELVRFVEPKAANLANAVLHRMVEAADDFPFGDPETDDAALARSCAFPGWISRRLIDELGRADAAEFMRASMGDAPVFVAVNFVRAKVSEIIQAFKEVGTEVEPIAGVPGCLRVHGAKAFKTPRIKRLFDEGKMLVSDQSAQAVALFALPKERPARFLEIGSGRATKTVLMQSAAYRRYGAFMDMVSVDDHAFKAEILRERMESYGIEGVEARVADGRMLSKSFDAGSFDAVFVDAPCSGIGTLRRHPEIKWRLTASDVSTLAMTGFDMLIEAAGLVRVGGMLTYSTCTAFKEENEQVVDRFLKMKTGESFVVESTMAVKLVEGGPDAHYAVRLRRVR